MRWTAENVALTRRIIALSALVAALVVILQVQPAYAAPCQAITKDYYEEPELINWCGYLVNSCSHIDRYGCETPWYVLELGPCCGGGGGPLCDC
jgi:hypothetical protein